MFAPPAGCTYHWARFHVSLETYGRYQLLKKLATGGMAQIYLARQVGPEGFEKLLVVKRILPHLAENEEFITMFLDEARIAARCWARTWARSLFSAATGP